MPVTLTATSTIPLPPCPQCGALMDGDVAPAAYLAADMDGWVALYLYKPTFDGKVWKSGTLFDRRYIGIGFGGLAPGECRVITLGPVMTVATTFTPASEE